MQKKFMKRFSNSWHPLIHSVDLYLPEQ